MNLLSFISAYDACGKLNLVDEAKVVKKIINKLCKSTLKNLNKELKNAKTTKDAEEVVAA